MTSAARRWNHRASIRLLAMIRAPFRAGPRDSEMVITVIAAAIGAAAAVIVIGLVMTMRFIESRVFAIPFGSHLSWGIDIVWWRLAAAPPLGGLVVGLAALAIRRWRPRDTIDAIEANALHGGRMSLIDSANLAFLTLLSVGFGGSLGLEAAATQLGAGVGSRVGRALRLRRSDLRALVGCGAAGAIAALFHAPLTGAFYAFELIIGTYSLTLLAPVAAASLAGSLIARAVFGTEPVFIVAHTAAIESRDYVAFVGLGLASAGVAILTMRGVTLVEQSLRRARLPVWARPMVGGALVGLIALAYPQVLGGGHGAILFNLRIGFPLGLLAGLILAKIAASALSVGSGFRGGLFSSSLFIGALFGDASALVLQIIADHSPLGPVQVDEVAYALVGMGSVAAGIIGAPITMILLVLETSSDFPLAVGVMAGVLACTLTVRQSFGYSFATWRFHLRGLGIRGATDVGWIGDLTVGRLMSSNAVPIPATATIAELRAAFPLGGAKRAFVVEPGGRYLGMIDVIEAHGAEVDAMAEAAPVTALLRGPPVYLTPETNIRTALLRFDRAELEALAVVDSDAERKLVGYLSEAYALRRYNQELERRRQEEGGDGGIFGPARAGGD